jgi:hypothetical protein
MEFGPQFAGALPEPSVVAGSRRYVRSQLGLDLPETDFSRVAISRTASKRIGKAYDRMPSFDPRAVPAYRAMREETMRQYEHMTKPVRKGGMGLDVEITPHDPYGATGTHKIINELRSDVREGKVKALSTATTGGHPFFTNDENDAFRAVHDVFGHLGSGRGVDMHGEEAAFQKHASMFSPLARKAMANETRGQNASLHLHGDFPEQKVGILGDAMESPQFASIGRTSADFEDARLENRKQGLA